VRKRRSIRRRRGHAIERVDEEIEKPLSPFTQDVLTTTCGVMLGMTAVGLVKAVGEAVGAVVVGKGSR
jgi:hypothetical protein